MNETQGSSLFGPSQESKNFKHILFLMSKHTESFSHYLDEADFTIILFSKEVETVNIEVKTQS